jgi:hypothetical protein
MVRSRLLIGVIRRVDWFHGRHLGGITKASSLFQSEKSADGTCALGRNMRGRKIWGDFSTYTGGAYPCFCLVDAVQVLWRAKSAVV